MADKQQAVLTLRLPIELYKEFKRLAYAKERSMNTLGAQLLKQAVTRGHKEADQRWQTHLKLQARARHRAEEDAEGDDDDY
jgi:hypothetical protein